MFKVFLISSVASLGVVAVVWGLWWENRGEKEWYRDIKEFRSSKAKARRGLKLVFWGVVAELILGFTLTVVEGIGSMKTANEIAKNSPLNQQVSDVSINAVLNVKGEYAPFLGEELSTWVTLNERNNMGSGVLNTLYLGGFSTLYSGKIQAGEHQETGNNYKTYSIQFLPERRFGTPQNGFVIADRSPLTPELMLENITALMLHVNFISQDAEVVGGSAEIIINGTFRKTFQIYPQKSDEAFTKQNPSFKGAFLWATNGIQSH